jgi:hypothetical protein
MIRYTLMIMVMMMMLCCVAQGSRMSYRMEFLSKSIYYREQMNRRDKCSLHLIVSFL